MKKLKIIFMGTSDFAVESLRQLIDNQYEIAAVVTTPDKPAGRGLKLKESAVKTFAVGKDLPVLQPLNLKSPEFLNQLSAFRANLFIIVAFRKLPDEVWKMPEFGTFNLHASLLPDYRGAAPINHAVINGETITGVTSFFLNSEIDTGNIILKQQVSIGPDETAGELHDRLMLTGAELVVQTVKQIELGTCLTTVQTNLTGSYKPAPRIFRDDCRINWSKSAGEVHNFIRGLSPYPGAFSILRTDKNITEIKILRSAVVPSDHDTFPGKVVIIENKRLLVSCAENMIEILQLRSAGKKTMLTSEFLRGFKAEFQQFES